MNAFASRLMLTLLFAPSAFAASSTDLTVKGLIIPNACEPLISSGGIVDFGKMSAKQLNADQPTTLPGQHILLSVRCEGPTFFTLNTIDNRAGTSANHDDWHGLGMTSEGEKLGGSAFHLNTPMADGAPVQTITSTDGGATWQTNDMLSHSMLTAVAMADGLAPIAVSSFDAEISLRTHIAPANSLTLTDEVPVDGHATVQVNYL
jgi:type 1 fimbria pilin